MSVTYNKKSIEDVDVKGKRVFVRADLNVPTDENGVVQRPAHPRVDPDAPVSAGIRARP